MNDVKDLSGLDNHIEGQKKLIEYCEKKMQEVSFVPKEAFEKKPLKKKRRKWFDFTVYNHCKRMKELGEDCPKEKQRIVIHWNWHVPHIPFEAVEYCRSARQHQFLFSGTDNIYWVFFKSSSDGKYKFFKKTTNDHCACGG